MTSHVIKGRPSTLPNADKTILGVITIIEHENPVMFNWYDFFPDQKSTDEYLPLMTKRIEEIKKLLPDTRFVILHDKKMTAHEYLVDLLGKKYTSFKLYMEAYGL